MIVVDTSAIMAMALGEPKADHIRQAINEDGQLLMSAGTLAETLIVADRRNIGPLARGLLNSLGVAIEPVHADFCEHVANAYSRWGKGVHPAALGFGDCFAYALAKQRDCPLLFVGDDFARTDVKRAI